MKIGIQTWGSDGDILPFIALAIGLRSSGHKVTVVYTSVDNKDYSSFTTDSDINVIKAYERFEEDRAKTFDEITKAKDPLKELAMVLDSYFVPAINEMYMAAKTLCSNSDLVIGHGIHYPLATAAQKTNCPRVSVALCPMAIETSSVSPFDINLGEWLNLLLWKLGDRIVRKKIYGAADALRKKEGLPPFNSLQRDLYVTEKLTLIATSAILCPRPPDWSDNIQICGYLNPPRHRTNWEMPPELRTFFEKGKPPVYFTFGSCAQFDLERNTRLFLEAAKMAGVRAIVQSDWDVLSLPDEDSNVYRVNSIPHEHIFPHCALIVHHGGSGTTQSSLKAGKPSVVVAHAFDQPYWGKKLMQLGVAGKVLQRRKTTSDVLAKGIRTVLDSPQMIDEAQKARTVMERENGVDNAVSLINKIFN
jgi:sterol 3beta-glucosyltransferase